MVGPGWLLVKAGFRHSFGESAPWPCCRPDQRLANARILHYLGASQPRDVKVLRALSTAPRGSGQIPTLGIRQRRSGKLELPTSPFRGVISYHQPTPQCGNAHYSMISSQARIRCDIILRCVAPDSEIPSPGIKTVLQVIGNASFFLSPLGLPLPAPAISSISLSPRNYCNMRFLAFSCCNMEAHTTSFRRQQRRRIGAQPQKGR